MAELGPLAQGSLTIQVSPGAEVIPKLDWEMIHF